MAAALSSSAHAGLGRTEGCQGVEGGFCAQDRAGSRGTFSGAGRPETSPQTALCPPGCLPWTLLLAPAHTAPSPPLSHPIFWRKNPSEHCCSLFSSPGKHSLLTLSEPHLLPLPRGDLILSGGGICEVQKPSTLSAQGSSLTNHYYRCLRSGLRAAEGPALQGGPGCVPDRSQLSMRFRSASTQKSLPSTLSTTRATGRMRPVVKRTSRSVPSRAARSILAARSCMLVKYRYLQERAGEGRAPHPVPRPGLSLPSTKETSPDPLGIQ